MSNKFGHRNHQDNYIPPYDAGLLAEPIEKAGFSAEVVAKLQAGKVYLLLDIVKRTEKDMYKINTFNKKNLFEVKNVLHSKRITFRPEAVKEADAKPDNRPSDNSPDDNRPNDRPNDIRLNERQGRQRFNPREARTQNTVNVKPDRNAARENQRNNRENRQGNDNMQAGGRGNPNRERKDISQPQNVKLKSQQTRPEVGDSIKNKDKRIWDADGVSEQRTKEEHEKRRPPKPAVGVYKDSYIKINKNDKWGFADRNGKEVVPPIYDEVFVYKEDLCCVEKDGLFGYINRQGEEVIPPVYDCALSFSEGYACVCKNNKCGYINKNNEVVIDFKFDAGTPVIEDNCRVKKDGKWGELYIGNPNEIRWI